MGKEEVKALIHLLDDPDEEVYREVSNRLIKKGGAIVAELEKAWESSLNERMQNRLETLIQQIQFAAVLDNVKGWIQSGTENLLEGAYHIAHYQYPDIRIENIENQIDNVKQDIWLELSPQLTALEKVRIINHFLYDVYKFSGNSTNFYSPQNSYINQVIETRKGNPISLAILYSVLARKLDIPIYGVNLPKNFILAYVDEVTSSETILFYINPFNRGAVLGRREIDYFLQQQGISPQESFYLPCRNGEIIQRLILNLIHSYEKLGYTDKIHDLKKLYQLFQDMEQE